METWQSEQIGDLVAAIVAAQTKMVPAVKDHVNPYFKSKYADLPSVWEAAEPFRAEGVAITQMPMDAPDGWIVLDTQLSHKSGQWMRSRLKLRVAKDDPQGYGSALTYARRYALGCMTGIVTEEDDDGNAASVPPAQHQRDAKAKIAELRREGLAVSTPSMEDGGRVGAGGPSLPVAPTSPQQAPDAPPSSFQWRVPKVAWTKTDGGKLPAELSDESLNFYVNYYTGKLEKDPNSRYREEWSAALRALADEAMCREAQGLPLGE